MSALRWTLKSTFQLTRDLQARGFRVSAELVRRLLHQMGYSLLPSVAGQLDDVRLGP